MIPSTLLYIIIGATALGHLASSAFLIFLASKKESASTAKWGIIGLMLGLIGVALYFMLEEKPES